MKPVQLRTAIIVFATSALVACGSDDDDSPPAPAEPMVRTYEVSVSNTTAGQPFSPVAVLLSSEPLWTVGEPASDALALMAESGDNSGLIDADGVLATESGTEAVAPGDQALFSISVEGEDELLLSVATMLVNTNDAFTGITGYALAGLTVGDSRMFYAPVYDAGTEENTEESGTIPGPADGGEGVSEGREPLNKVFMHGGVVTQHDGLMSSVLTHEHRFDNPAIAISVTRLE